MSMHREKSLKRMMKTEELGIQLAAFVRENVCRNATNSFFNNSVNISGGAMHFTPRPSVVSYMN